MNTNDILISHSDDGRWFALRLSDDDPTPRASMDAVMRGLTVAGEVWATGNSSVEALLHLLERGGRRA